MKADKEVRLSWTGSGLVFDGGPVGGPQLVVDGDSATGPSPMDLVLVGVAACMAIDVKVILEKGRVPFDALDVTARGERRDRPPRHYSALQLVFNVKGVPPGSRTKVARAIELSREKYCSVLFSLRQDLELETVIEGG
ncbi:MAG: OsmC family protein [Gemmatimonadota bacterium]|nr:OsmC family protein [Gemmatimonadota bacterium]MDE2871679.1 OsmC family protein [Gemmatimonadota bacterium]